ncbi:hypothetical protein D3C73_1620130 [compost metagenome]
MIIGRVAFNVMLSLLGGDFLQILDTLVDQAEQMFHIGFFDAREGDAQVRFAQRDGTDAVLVEQV